jgi:hypothetical protein
MVRDKSFSHHDSKEALQQQGRAVCRLVNRSGRPYLDNLLYELVNDPGVQAEFRDSLGLCERERGQKGSFRRDVPMKSVLERALSHFSDSLKANFGERSF